ncbi:hypothetical protein [Paenirhodobacter populi]|uniref:hypothetical protein n=1 Tax=Paenirhodobacter populi TaxID=2306993 RepID=UPI000FE39693|nr:hypothetical protein [Sinirhodobacter populi]RWR09789.1 hypothetical protein D2T32_05465 [Sinirhodobacter populi]
MDRFVERSAIIEFDGGMDRFEAETLAAQAQGFTRWQAMQEVRNAERIRNSEQARNHGSAMVGHNANAVSVVQRQPVSSASENTGAGRDVQAGRGTLVLPSLWRERL